MKDVFIGKLEKGEEKRFQWNILLSGKLKLFPRITLSLEQGEKNAKEGYECIADISSLRRLSKMKSIGIFDAIEVVTEVMRGMNEAADYFIMPWAYEVRKDFIFVSPAFNQIRMIYCPYKYSSEAKGKLGETIIRKGEKLWLSMDEQIKEEDRDIYLRGCHILSGASYGMESVLRQLTKLQEQTLPVY